MTEPCGLSTTLTHNWLGFTETPGISVLNRLSLSGPVGSTQRPQAHIPKQSWTGAHSWLKNTCGKETGWRLTTSVSEDGGTVCSCLGPQCSCPAPDSQTRLKSAVDVLWFQEWTWSLVSGESVDVECLVLEHSSEVSCIGRQVPLNLLTEARVISRPQVGVTVSWPIHLLKPKQTQTELEWW